MNSHNLDNFQPRNTFMKRFQKYTFTTKAVTKLGRYGKGSCLQFVPSESTKLVLACTLVNNMIKRRAFWEFDNQL